jgi:hypothetical protein
MLYGLDNMIPLNKQLTYSKNVLGMDCQTQGRLKSMNYD